MADAGLIAIVALVRPSRRPPARRRADAGGPLPGDLRRHAARDLPAARSQGALQKADQGKVSNLTGRDQPYEAPEDPDLVLRRRR
jgi:bifunctional enzyme CysN/CysC